MRAGRQRRTALAENHKDDSGRLIESAKAQNARTSRAARRVLAQWLAERDDIDGVICIGSVIRGETAHFDYVCSAAAQGILRVNQDTGKPVMFCVLTDDTHEQAAARSGGEHGNKGVEAAVGLLNMLALRQTLSPSRS